MGGGHSKALTYVVGFSSLTILGTLACYLSLSTNTLACTPYAACVSCIVCTLGMLLACVACMLCTLATKRAHTEDNLQSFVRDNTSALIERKPSLSCALSFLNIHSHISLSTNFSYFISWASPAVSRFIYLCSCICSTAFPGAYTTTFTHSRSATSNTTSNNSRRYVVLPHQTHSGGGLNE